MTNFIPIFPLAIVVYPGEKLNLHIFEPRYKQLIIDCMETKKPFGIPTVLNNEVKELGTLVQVKEIVKTYDNGEMDIITEGIKATHRYLFPADIRHRTITVNMAYLDASDLYLRLGEHGKAIETLSQIDPSGLQPQERGRYHYIQARYWLTLGRVNKAQEWLSQSSDVQTWDPEWPVLRLDVRASIAEAQGNESEARELLDQALAEAEHRNLHGLAAVIRRREQKRRDKN